MHLPSKVSERLFFQGKLDEKKEYELARFDQPSDRYNGGQLLAELDKGFLYLTTGDGAMKYQQSKRFDPSQVKILRLFVSYRGYCCSTGLT